MKAQHNPTLASSFCDLRTRKINETFFTQINTLLDWDKIGKIIDHHYKRGKNATTMEGPIEGIRLNSFCSNPITHCTASL